MDQELSDPVIGLLTHDGYYYNGSGTYGDVQFEFTIGTYKVADVPARLEKARAIYRAVDSVVDRTANYAASTEAPNPSIEGDVQELSLLAAPHVKR
jgi:hypothetical protein